MSCKKIILEKFLYLLAVIMMFFSINSIFIEKFNFLVFLAAFITANFFLYYSGKNFPNKRLKICNYGVKGLKLFNFCMLCSIGVYIVFAFKLYILKWLLNVAISILLQMLIFFIGIVLVYCTSLQLGIKTKIIGVIFAFVPIVNIFLLHKIIKISSEEVEFETNKFEMNVARKEQAICKTKYPILLVHGVFFRDSEKLNYWGRIPHELELNGATIFYGNHQSALSIKDSAKELANRINEIVEKTKCEKVNVIAHSKGGLDCRYALANLGIQDKVASLITINTPHRGCKFADYLLDNMAQSVKQSIANNYNKILKKLGDTNPDFIAAVNDLTSSRCEVLDRQMNLPDGIYSKSIGSKLNKAIDGMFPLNFSYLIANKFDGANDGLVGVQSFAWGNNYEMVTSTDKCGLSHADVIDLTRINIAGFDVREFYVQLVFELKRRGL